MSAGPSTGTELLAEVREWIAQDPDGETRAELRSLVDTATDSSAGEKAAQAAVADLAERFSGFLQFGTAGLRAELAAGPMRMNRVVVQRAAAGLAAHVIDVVDAPSGSDPRPPRAVIGFDARKNSAIFARDTAAIFTAAGIETLLLPSPLPTPVLAWAMRAHDAEVGVMVTASHNPPADNGYKVYLGGRAVEESGRGCQIVPPHDAQIAAQIAAVGDIREVAKAESGWTVLPTSVEQDYLSAVVDEPARAAAGDDSAAASGAVGHAGPDGRGDTDARGRAGGQNGPRIVLTAMHGVGGPTAVEALRRAGFTDVHPVAEQFQPDPLFPTVAFPNPEEPGALDLAFTTARAVGADLIIANDPDADRCAVAVPDVGHPNAEHPDPEHPEAVAGWRMLRGDEVGVLLGLAALRSLQQQPRADAVLANSIVSSRLLGRMAAAAGVAHQETLTGFKWIARVPGIVYGYEEALGYCVAPDTVRDKDGISAAVAIAQLARDAAVNGRTLTDELADLAVEHGLFSTDQLSIRVADLGLIPQMMTALRENTPKDLAGSPVAEVRDLANPPVDSPLPPTDGLLLLTEDDTRVIVRRSGTEPKLKCYLEVVTGVPSPEALTTARRHATARLDAVKDQLRALLTS